MALLLTSPEKLEGRVFTPDSIAEALCRWAIQKPTDTVLDLGVGEGAFLLAAGRRLRGLGTPLDRIAEAIHGAEREPAVFARAVAAFTDAQLQILGDAWRTFTTDQRGCVARACLDQVVGEALSLPPWLRDEVEGALTELVRSTGDAAIAQGSSASRTPLLV